MLSLFLTGAKVTAPQFRSGSAPGRLAGQSESTRRLADSDRLRLRQESVSGNGQAGAYKFVHPRPATEVAVFGHRF